ncbi:response regulator transcription factor [Uliginosibacterium gangwonense]|uniref:response regulator transcription factor n=1 Tax=Uliginosibacterium gangwonense TaxID=392736 RepID=UPI000372309F|nr:response regulator [Uliginosibacterium gangwonense]
MDALNRFAHVKLVIIDDNDTTRAMLRSILRSEGIEVVAEARDGAGGLALVKKHQPNVVCLDVMMPDMSGIEVLNQLKQEFPEVRVIMVTGSTDRDTVQAAIEGGASGYLVKPFNAGKVVGALDLVLGRKPS